MTNQAIKNDTGLADFMKHETWDLHTEAETTGFINKILRGTAELPHYISFLKNLKPIYEAIESSSQWLESFPSLKPFLSDKIARSQTLAHDIEHLSALCKDPICPTIFQSTQNYQSSVENALTKNHSAMLAHIYVRYLGDLNGGLILRRVLAKNLDLSASCLTFYSFPKIDDIADFKTHFRLTLNDIELNESDKKLVSIAAKDAFKFNIELSKTLDKYIR